MTGDYHIRNRSNHKSFTVPVGGRGEGTGEKFCKIFGHHMTKNDGVEWCNNCNKTAEEIKAIERREVKNMEGEENAAGSVEGGTKETAPENSEAPAEQQSGTAVAPPAADTAQEAAPQEQTAPPVEAPTETPAT